MDVALPVAILRSSIPTEKREDWNERQLKAGAEVVICHPKLVETGLDLLAFPTLYFYEIGYSLHTLRQASRRSWRIGQKFPVRVRSPKAAMIVHQQCRQDLAFHCRRVVLCRKRARKRR